MIRLDRLEWIRWGQNRKKIDGQIGRQVGRQIGRQIATSHQNRQMEHAYPKKKRERYTQIEERHQNKKKEALKQKQRTQEQILQRIHKQLSYVNTATGSVRSIREKEVREAMKKHNRLDSLNFKPRNPKDRQKGFETAKLKITKEY